MKILVLTGSPRRGGNSDIMASAFCAAAKERGAEVVRFDTAFMRLEMCRACDRCFSGQGACIFDDDFNAIWEALLDADALVIASPVYWYSFPAQLKAAIDKLYSLCVSGRDLQGKQYALIACCEDDNDEAFKGLCFSLDKSMELLKCEKLGQVLVHGVHKKGAVNDTQGPTLAAELASRLVRL